MKYANIIFFSLFIVSWLFIFTNCSSTGPDSKDSEKTNSSSTVTTINIEPSNATITETKALSFTATVLDQNSNTMNGQSVSWASSDETVATIDGDEMAEAVSEGTSNITTIVDDISSSSILTVTFNEGNTSHGG